MKITTVQPSSPAASVVRAPASCDVMGFITLAGWGLLFPLGSADA